MKALYVSCVILSFICFFCLPAFIDFELINKHERYPKLFREMFLDNKYFNSLKYIGFGNAILIDLLIAFMPVANFLIVAFSLLCCNDTILDKILDWGETHIDGSAKSD